VANLRHGGAGARLETCRSSWRCWAAFIAVAPLFLASAPAYGMQYQRGSTPNAISTIATLRKVPNASSAPAVPASPTVPNMSGPPAKTGHPDPASSVSEQPHSPSFQEGLADRRAWAAWFAGLSGDYQSGARFWFVQTLMTVQDSCDQPVGYNPNAWIAGCREAQQRLATPTMRRETDPEYRQGWISFQETRR
jgi:hypothetical protein